jgi:hypothetical protein
MVMAIEVARCLTMGGAKRSIGIAAGTVIAVSGCMSVPTAREIWRASRVRIGGTISPAWTSSLTRSPIVRSTATKSRMRQLTDEEG